MSSVNSLKLPLYFFCQPSVISLTCVSASFCPHFLNLSKSFPINISKTSWLTTVPFKQENTKTSKTQGRKLWHFGQVSILVAITMPISLLHFLCRGSCTGIFSLLAKLLENQPAFSFLELPGHCLLCTTAI